MLINYQILIYWKKQNFKKLNLSCIQLSDIKVLGNIKYKNIENLLLSYNKISDKSALEKVDFKELKCLDLIRIVIQI